MILEVSFKFLNICYGCFFHIILPLNKTENLTHIFAYISWWSHTVCPGHQCPPSLTFQLFPVWGHDPEWKQVTSNMDLFLLCLTIYLSEIWAGSFVLAQNSLAHKSEGMKGNTPVGNLWPLVLKVGWITKQIEQNWIQEWVWPSDSHH